jgi:hypothetical protein
MEQIDFEYFMRSCSDPSCKEIWLAATKKALENILDIPEDEEMVGFVDRIDIQNMLEKLK